MINLHVMDPTGTYVLFANGLILGPVHGKNDNNQVISYRHPADRLSGSPHKILDEGDVSHTKIEGNIILNPSFSSLSPSPDLVDRPPGKVVYFPYRNANGDYREMRCSYFPNYANWLFKSGYYYSPIVAWDNLRPDGFDNFETLSYGRVWMRKYQLVEPVSDEKYLVRLEQWYIDTDANVSDARQSTTAEQYIRHVKDIIATDPNVQHSITYNESPCYRMDKDWIEPTSPSKITSQLNSVNPLAIARRCPTVAVDDFGSLAMQACEKLDAIDTNAIALLRDLPNSKDLIPKLKNLSALKTHASNYLALNYGVLPTISDLKEILGVFNKSVALDRNGRKLTYGSSLHSASSGSFSSSVSRHVKIAIDPLDSGLNALLEQLENFGLGLNFTNLWDLIPYSFVIDWFVDVGSFLERVDTRLRLLRLPVTYCTYSDKTTSTVEDLSHLGITGCFGSLSYVSYNRWTSYDVPLPPLLLEPDIQVQHHWLESAALILQRR